MKKLVYVMLLLLGLASIADKKALNVLEDAVKDENPVVRKVARMGIEAIKKKE